MQLTVLVTEWWCDLSYILVLWPRLVSFLYKCIYSLVSKITTATKINSNVTLNTSAFVQKSHIVMYNREKQSELGSLIWAMFQSLRDKKNLKFSFRVSSTVCLTMKNTCKYWMVSWIWCTTWYNRRDLCNFLEYFLIISVSVVVGLC